MKQNKISIEINCPVKEIFEFTLNPKNTPLWIDSVVCEETNEWPVKLGTKYKNVNGGGQWSEYTVVKFGPKVFEMKQSNSSYHVSYTFEQISDKKTKLTYFEWVDKGELNDPFTLSVLEKLKKVIEGKT